MNLQKEEKKFWQTHFRIEKLDSIPKAWPLIGGIGNSDELFDEYFYFISLRVDSVQEIILKESHVTDEGIKHMVHFKDLKSLYLRKHPNITKASIPYFNAIQSLESLNITKTNISLTHLSEGLNNQSLKEVFLDSEAQEEDLLEKAFILKERMPQCNIYLDTSFTTDVHGNPIPPIF